MSERRRRPPELTFLRPVPGSSPVHQLWAGTKLLAVAAVAVVLSLRANWAAIGIMGALVVVAVLMARIPRGAVPRLPKWFWIALLFGAVLTLESSAPPVSQVAGITVSWGGLESWGQITLLTVVMLAAAALFSWTTPLAEVAPALSRLGRPLRRLHFPVDEWATAVALSIRCLPLLIDEVRTLAAARKLRPSRRAPRESRLNWWARETRDLLFAALAVSLRRASELGDAIEARGGFGSVGDASCGPGRWDVLALFVVTAASTAAMLL